MQIKQTNTEIKVVGSQPQSKRLIIKASADQQ